MKVKKEASNHRFISLLPPGLSGTCDVCQCEVETEWNEPNDGVTGRSREVEGNSRYMRIWEVKCPTKGCSGWTGVG